MRIEEDFIGKVEVPDNAYYGSFTARAARTFDLSGMRVHQEITHAVALIKACSAEANRDLGVLDKEKAGAIIKAAEEVMEGRFEGEFILDAFQAGAGTPLHMNVNEVIANRAEELLGGKKGQYRIVHPNNHVNMSQSSNDVTPTAIRIACLRLALPLIREAEALKATFVRKAKEHKDDLKIGRTHLQDAVPMTFGQSFMAYAESLDRDIKDLEREANGLHDLGIGGNAIGTGINAHPDFRKKVVKALEDRSGLGLRMASDPICMNQDMNDLLSYSSSLRRYALTLNRIANDIRLLMSGPRAGIAELRIPEVEPGSSIMPGKINPSVPEAVNMVCFQSIANDQAVMLGASMGQLELNFYTPLIGHNLVQSIKMLSSATKMFREDCVSGMEADRRIAKENLDRTYGYATALNPYLGYKEVSLLVREALGRGANLRSIILEKKLIEGKELDRIMAGATGPSVISRKEKKK